MNILHFAALSGFGGIERQFQRFLNHFHAHRTDYPGFTHSLLAYHRTIHRDIIDDITRACRQVHMYKRLWPDLLLPPLVRPLRCRSLFSAHGYDTLVTWSILRNATQARTIRSFPGRRVFYDHGWSTQAGNGRMGSLDMFDTCIANSHATRMTLAEKYRVPQERIAVLHNSYPDRYAAMDRDRLRGPMRAQLGFQPGDKVVICVGRMVFIKGFTIALEALRHLADPNIKLLLVGNGRAADTLRKLIGDYRLQDRVVWPGYVADPMAMYAAADLMLMPSCREPFGIVLLEAAAAGLPVIANDIDGIRDTLTGPEDGWLTEPARPPAAYPYIPADAVPDLVFHPRLGRLAPPLFPDPQEVAGLINAVFRQPADAAARTAHLRRRVLEEFSTRKYTDGFHAILSGPDRTATKGTT
ncbi:MAG: glycosyltransferase [Planctomycetota bacterium]